MANRASCSSMNTRQDVSCRHQDNSHVCLKQVQDIQSTEEVKPPMCQTRRSLKPRLLDTMPLVLLQEILRFLDIKSRAKLYQLGRFWLAAALKWDVYETWGQTLDLTQTKINNHHKLSNFWLLFAKSKSSRSLGRNQQNENPETTNLLLLETGLRHSLLGTSSVFEGATFQTAGFLTDDQNNDCCIHRIGLRSERSDAHFYNQKALPFHSLRLLRSQFLNLIMLFKKQNVGPGIKNLLEVHIRHLAFDQLHDFEFGNIFSFFPNAESLACELLVSSGKRIGENRPFLKFKFPSKIQSMWLHCSQNVLNWPFDHPDLLANLSESFPVLANLRLSGFVNANNHHVFIHCPLTSSKVYPLRPNTSHQGFDHRRVDTMRFEPDRFLNGKIDGICHYPIWVYRPFTRNLRSLQLIAASVPKAIDNVSSSPNKFSSLLNSSKDCDFYSWKPISTAFDHYSDFKHNCCFCGCTGGLRVTASLPVCDMKSDQRNHGVLSNNNLSENQPVCADYLSLDPEKGRPTDQSLNLGNALSVNFTKSVVSQELLRRSERHDTHSLSRQLQLGVTAPPQLLSATFVNLSLVGVQLYLTSFDYCYFPNLKHLSIQFCSISSLAEHNTQKPNPHQNSRKIDANQNATMYTHGRAQEVRQNGTLWSHLKPTHFPTLACVCLNSRNVCNNEDFAHTNFTNLMHLTLGDELKTHITRDVFHHLKHGFQMGSNPAMTHLRVPFRLIQSTREGIQKLDRIRPGLQIKGLEI